MSFRHAKTKIIATTIYKVYLTQKRHPVTLRNTLRCGAAFSQRLIMFNGVSKHEHEFMTIITIDKHYYTITVIVILKHVIAYNMRM